MNCKHLISRFWAFFTSVLFVAVVATESIAVTYVPGQDFGVYDYTRGMTFDAVYVLAECEDGMYLPDGATECVQCPAGYYCAAGAQPVLCPAGRYCEAGTSSSSGTGVLAAGYYSTGGATKSKPSLTDCVNNADGSMNECGMVSAGYWNNGCGKSKTGEVCSSEYAGGLIKAGYYSTGGATAATGEGQCAEGYYCPAGSVSSHEKNCPTKYTNSLAGAAKIQDCYVVTEAGKYVATAGAGQTACVAPYYCPGGVTVAYDGVGGNKQCDAGYTTNNKAGATACELAVNSIKYEVNGGTITSGSGAGNNTCTIESADVLLPTPNKTGYTFVGWFDNAELTGNKITKISAGECLSDYQFYAKWQANTYTVTLDKNGGNGGADTVQVVFGSNMSNVTVPTLEGYSFKGYYSAAEGGVKYYDMQGKPVVKWDIDSDATLYAQWMADGQCAPGTYYNETTGSVEPCPAKSYCPGGTWSTEGGNNCAIEGCPTAYPNSVEGASHEGQCYAEKDNCTCLDDTVTCQAKGANSCVYSRHTIKNGAVYSGTTDCVAAPGSSDNTYCAIRSVTCKSNSYFTIKDDIVNGVCESCSNLHDGSYTISNSLAAYKPKSDVGAQACYQIVDLPCTAPVCPTKDTGSCTYDATDFEYGGGYLYYGMSEALPGKKKDYICPDASFTCFEGYDKNAAADIDPSDGSASEPEDLCTPHVYTFTLDGNGADTPNVQIYEKYNTGWFSNANATNTISRVAIPVRTYYTFAGYYTKPTALEGGVQVIKESGEILDKPDVAADTTLYAWWRVNTYTVVYDANGGTGSMANVKHTCTEPKNLSKNAFTSATNNREFLGWARNSTATTPEFTDGAQVVNLTADDNAKVTLYAVWKDCTKCAAGTGAVCKLTAPVGVCVYDTSCSANYENLQNDGKYNPTCSAIKYGLTYETNGGVISSSFNKVTECTVESGAIVLPKEEQMTKADYRFDGWYDNNAFSGSAITTLPAGSCTATKTLYAKWTINIKMCEVGKYYNGNSFVDCPNGYYCPGEGKVTIGKSGCSVACPNGYTDGDTGYSSQSQCKITVPQGSYLADAKSTQMTVCPAGKYTASAIKVAYGETSSCVLCEANSYCADGAKYSCASKTNNVFVNSVEGSDSVNDCYATTVAGKYITANAVETCVAPYYCPGDIQVFYGNEGGTKSCSALSDNIEWESGIITNGASTSDLCYVSVDAGHYWNGKNFATCTAGTYNTAHRVNYGDTSSCLSCAAGYKSDNGASECHLMTTAGKYVATAGAGEVMCKSGDYCPGNVKVMFSDVGGNTSCTTLGAAYLSDSGAKTADMCYKSCELTSHATQMTGRDYYGAGKDTCEAVDCESGYILAYGSCGSCPADHVCDPNYDGGKPHTCSELTGGKYTKSAENSVTINACYTITTAGKYVATVGAGEVSCKVGDYCLGGVKVMYTAVGGNMSCATFGDGYSSDVGAAAETQCYQRCAMADNATAMSGRDYYGTDTTDTCAVATCTIGYTVSDGACVVCPADHVCDPAKDNGKPYSCSELTDGVYTKSDTKNGSVDNCYLVTEAGKYVATAGAGQVTCAANGYCAGGTKVMRVGTGGRDACPADYASADSGATTMQQCYKRCEVSGNATAMTGRDYYGTDATDTCSVSTCGLGFTVVNGSCVVCPADHVCDPAKDNGKPESCSELTSGVYTRSDVKNGSVDNCYLVTEAGKYVATAGAGQVTCAANGYCAGGTKVMRVGTGGRDACPADYAKSDVGATTAQMCYSSCSMASNAYEMSGRDYYANGTDTCKVELCKAGYTLANDETCKLCPANNVCRPDVLRGAPQLCSVLTDGTHEFAASGSGTVADCYQKCEAIELKGGSAVPVSDTEFYPAQCTFEGVSNTGNPCDIVDGKCVEKTCNYNFEMVDGVCEPCARENALGYKQGAGNCIVESCVNGYHPNGQSCEANIVECSVPNAISAERVWDANKQAFGECVITECEDGYHLGANTCQADEQVCEVEHGVGIREWNHKTGKWGDCIATKCDPGYTNERGLTNELWKQCGRCNNMYSAGGELAASSYVDGCEIASCMYEGELYTLENNECVLICDTYSDETGARKWNASRKKCERTCSPGYMSW